MNFHGKLLKAHRVVRCYHSLDTFEMYLYTNIEDLDGQEVHLYATILYNCEIMEGVIYLFIYFNASLNCDTLTKKTLHNFVEGSKNQKTSFKGQFTPDMR